MIDKTAVAKSFSRAADTYDSAAHFQRQIANHLFALADKSKVSITVDLGSGTGYLTPTLAQYTDQLINLDIAEGMLTKARTHHALAHPICADAECLPLANQSIDRVIASLSVQWCYRLDQLFSELYRVLKPGGIIVLSTLTQGTLYELAKAWSFADPTRTHVNHFYTTDRWQDAIRNAGFCVSQHQHQRYTLQYDSTRQLMKELKSLGAHNINQERSRGLTQPSVLKKVEHHYEQHRRAGRLPATYEVDYWCLFKSC